MRITALIYHDVLADRGADDSGFAGADALSYKLTETRFRHHLDLIRALPRMRGPTCLLPAVSDPSGNALVLTFDDGGVSASTRILPTLRQYDWSAYFFVTTDLIGTPGFMAAQGLRELHAAGHVIGSHSASHPARMSALSHERICREWRDSRRRLEDLLGAPVTAASVPGGYYSRSVASAAAQVGMRLLFTSEPRRSVSEVDGMAVIGRFSVTQRTSDADILSLASGRRGAALRQRLAWDMKKIVKRFGGETWLNARRRFFELRRR